MKVGLTKVKNKKRENYYKRNELSSNEVWKSKIREAIAVTMEIYMREKR